MILEKLDILNREEFLIKLVNLTENISANRTSTSFAINGVWGCGKSFVLDMYEERLTKIQSEETATDKYFVIRYNCWKYDYYEEPLVAIVAAMIDIINQKTKLWNDEQKKARVLGVLKAVGTTLLSMVNAGVKDKIGVDIKNTYETLKTNVQAEEEKVEKSHEYDVYFSFNQALRRLQKLIAELCQDQTVVFMVDELDRCLPEYSIKVLERLHHLTENSNNVITVLSMDKAQLQTSVKQIFGFDEPEKYLEKFIQFEIKLDCGEISELITEKYAEYINLFEDSCPVNDSIEEFIQVIFKDINVRTQEQIIKRATTAHTLLFNKSKSKPFMCMELLVTVINHCYSGKITFCKMFEKTFHHFESSKVDPPFAAFFNERFQELPCTPIQNVGLNNKHICRYNPSQSLYADILFWWSQIFFADKQTVITLKDEDLKNQLTDEISDLKKFNDTVKFIK